ncbi:Hint domain-containing protein, partial [Acidisoma sp. 7E03]
AATVVLGSAAGIDTLDTEGTLTLGANAVVEASASTSVDMITGNGTLINAGTILADAGSGSFAIGPTSLVNNGLIAVSGGIEMDIEPTGSFTNAGTLTVGDGSTLAIQFAGAASNTGTVAVAGGVLTADETIGGTGGSITLADGASAMLAGTGAGQTLAFTDGTDSLTLTAPIDFAGTITGFRSGDSITLDGVTSATESYADGVLTVSEGGTIVANLAIAGNYQTSDFTALESGGTLVITTDVPCFAAGTRILTTRGEVPVEALVPGDRVVTVTDGAEATADVTWVGHRLVDLKRHPAPEKVRPVRVQRGAFGPRMPARDLVLSPDHAIFAEGVLVPVKYLVNGSTVRFDPAIDRITYFHVELTQHEVLLAEGLPAESYLETGGRGMFENGGRPLVLHPDFAPLRWDVLGCAPLKVTGPEVERIAATLARRAARKAARVKTAA